MLRWRARANNFFASPPQTRSRLEQQTSSLLGCLQQFSSPPKILVHFFTRLPLAIVESLFSQYTRFLSHSPFLPFSWLIIPFCYLISCTLRHFFAISCHLFHFSTRIVKNQSDSSLSCLSTHPIFVPSCVLTHSRSVTITRFTTRELLNSFHSSISWRKIS